MLVVTLRADCAADIPVEEIHLVRRGPGFSTDIAAVYAEIAGRRVSQAVTPQRDGTLTLRLQGVAIPACGETVLGILMDVASTAEVASEHRLVLADHDPVVASTASVTVGALAHGTVSPVHTAAKSTGTVAVEYLRLLQRISYGRNRIVLRLRLSASGERDLQVRRMVLTNEGSARDADLKNIALYDNRGRRVSSVASQMAGDWVDLSFDPPLRIATNASRVLELHADALASRRRTIHFVVDEPGDIFSEEVRRSR